MFLLRSINYSFVIKELSVTQKEGIITCIPKQNKNRQFLKNWRPISLLNCTYKLASTCLANRLKNVLPHLINSDQTGFMAGRYIGENIRLIYDLFCYTEHENKPGLLLLVDFEKAFDSVSWSFINNVLDYFNFGPDFKQWINILYKNTKSCVQINGHISQWFNLQRGCRQGDPISPYIFLLCAEILAVMIRNNRLIKGIKVRNREFVISQYADDTSFILDGSGQSLEQALIVLKFYAEISGLGVNVDKTSVIWFGSMKNSNLKLCEDYNLHWEKGFFSLLGITMSTRLEDIVGINYEAKLREVANVFKAWSKRILTPFGKITVIKSIALPKLNHLFLGLPNPSEEFFKRLQNMCFTFLWKGGPDRIKRSVIIQGKEFGGLRMIDIEKFNDALKVSWIRRTFKEGKNCFKIHDVFCPFAERILMFGSDFIKNNIEPIRNPFWKDTYKALHKFTVSYKPVNWNDVLCTPLWYNSNIKVGRRSCFIRQWSEHGIHFITDLMDRNGNFLSLREFQEKYNINTNFLSFQGIIAACRTFIASLSIQHFPTNSCQPVISSLYYPVIKNVRGCRIIYDFLISHNIPASVRKWEQTINFDGVPDWKKFFKLLFKVTKDSTLLWFQERIFHRILATNRLLTKMNVKNDERCTFCQNEVESLPHIFWSCVYVQRYWTEFNNFLQLKGIRLPHEWNDIDILFGSTQYDIVLNQLVLKAKFFIYRKRMEENIPVFTQFLPNIRYHYQTERYNAVKNSKLEKFDKSWSLYRVLAINN